MRKNKQQFAGNLVNASFMVFQKTPVLVGELSEDLKGRFLDGSPIRTSWVVSAAWDYEGDYLVVKTRNSVYHVAENLIETQLKSKVAFMSGDVISATLTSEL